MTAAPMTLYSGRAVVCQRMSASQKEQTMWRKLVVLLYVSAFLFQGISCLPTIF